MSFRKSVLNPLLARVGYRLERHRRDQPGAEPIGDIAGHFQRRGRADDQLIVFDVGANVGAFAIDIRRHLPKAIIHAFEPDQHTAAVMRERTSALDHLTINVCGLGEAPATASLQQFEHHYMNSLLPPGPAKAGDKVVGTVEVEVQTLDGYCAAHGINHMDLLKTDTQGFDLQVLRGGAGMLEQGAVELVLCEIIFTRNYEGMGCAHEIMQFLHERGFELMAVYPTNYKNQRAAYTDMLFVNGAS